MTKLIITLDIDNDDLYEGEDPKVNGPEVTWGRLLELLRVYTSDDKSLSIRDGLSAPIDQDLMIGHLRIDVEDPYNPREMLDLAIHDFDNNNWEAAGATGGYEGQRAIWHRTIARDEPSNLAEFEALYPVRPEFVAGFAVVYPSLGNTYVKGRGESWFAFYPALGSQQELERNFDRIIRDDIASGRAVVVHNPADTGKN